MSMKSLRRQRPLTEPARWAVAARDVLTTAEPSRKCASAAAALTALAASPFEEGGAAGPPPDRPSRPERPVLAAPSAVPRRRLGSPEGRIALLHALAHIEFNAIDLAFDMALRFAGEIRASGLDEAEFVRDWFAVGAEEALHFSMVDARLAELGSHYGALPAHDSLWESAARTADSALARLAVAPLVLEARGLDVTPGMAERLRAAGDEASGRILDKIFEDEIGHVATGMRWFSKLCIARGLAVRDQFRDLVASRFKGALKPPFNSEARARAGVPEAFFREWNGPCEAESAANPERR